MKEPIHIQGTMLSRVKLRKILKDHKSGNERLDEILAKKSNFLDVDKKDQQQELITMDFSKTDTFHRAVAPILVFAQCFSIMPVIGVRHASPKYLRFTTKSPQFFWTLLFIFAGLVLACGMMRKIIRLGIDAKNIVGLVFFLCCMSANILFLSLSTRWSKLVQYWAEVELTFLKKPYFTSKRNLAKRIRTAAILIILLSALEHIFFNLSNIYSYNKQMRICNMTRQISFGHYITNSYDYVFIMVPYNTVIGVITLIINAALTFIWNYMDLFIMMVSQGMAYRFEQITVRIKRLDGEEVPEYVYSEIREHYVKLCELLEYIDENLSGIILLSCMNNLYFVCSQLLNIFNKLRWPINYIYFWYSLLYLICRTAFVFLSAASINDESKAPVGSLRKVSRKNWCIEVERLIFQMTTQTVALSGKKFYYLTRRLLFGMAGTIVTYELVLLQFDEPNRSKGLPELCLFSCGCSLLLKMSSSIVLRKSSQRKGTHFHDVVGYLFRFSQMFGVFPVSNITCRDVYQIHYRWLSIPTFIAAMFCLLNGLEFIAVIYMVLKVGVNFYTIGTLAFFCVCYLEQLLLWRLATKWPQIIQLWHRTEEIFFYHPYRLCGTFNMNLTIKLLSGILLLNTFLEHSMFLANAFNTSKKQIKMCDLNITFWEVIFRNETKQLNSIFNLQLWMLPILEWTNFSMAFVLAFTDIFIMSISIGVAVRLDQINRRINLVFEKPLPEIFWKKVRNDFLAVKKLIRILNSRIENLILVSCAYSMYFICLQLFNSFTKSGNLISKLFFWYSLLFVIGRTLFKLFAAAAIDDGSKKILETLKNIPSSSWGKELQLFFEQLLFDITAFSGCGFFFLTRKLIFAMAATIVTYELVVTDVIQESNSGIDLSDQIGFTCYDTEKKSKVKIVEISSMQFSLVWCDATNDGWGCRLGYFVILIFHCDERSVLYPSRFHNMKTKFLQRPKTPDGKHHRGPPSYSESDFKKTFHHIIGPFLLIAQFMGVLPVKGVLEKDLTKVHFSWIQIGVIVAFVLIAFLTLDLSLSLYIVILRGLKMYTVGQVSFSLTALLGFIAFLRIAQKWPELIRQYTNTEMVFMDKSYETLESKMYGLGLRRNGIILLLGVLVEQCIHIWSSLYNNNYQIHHCNFTVNFWENLYTRERLHLFSVIKFNIWMIPALEWLTICMLFAWNFIDIFLMLVTSSLAVRFGQVNKRIQRFKSSPMTDEFWLRARMDFISLLDLLQAVDEKLSELVLLSSASNLFYICFTIFQSFQSKGNLITTIHFFYSLGFVLTRIFITMLSEASINDASNDTLSAFYEIPIEFWGVELERFYEIASDFCSISGKGFFFITRKMMLAMAGTVLTYELVFFDQVTDVVDRVNFCIVRKV
ncbi:uncharacterized protein LOC129945239 [Eupeodes corollae]|uniref:uncharacterized protein LOC129945239 n=1 Tax=Eupeodes corollae TaxID=290404 RepID=UPI00248F5C75|nr:uncharacterized protein LOC129945239 [Eupeodes corollae]